MEALMFVIFQFFFKSRAVLKTDISPCPQWRVKINRQRAKLFDNFETEMPWAVLNKEWLGIYRFENSDQTWLLIG